MTMTLEKKADLVQTAAQTLLKSDESTQPSATSFDDLKLPFEFERYRLLKLLGRGGMGSVYLAFDTELQRNVALKIPSFTKGESSDAIERFRREARLAATLDHTNICRVYDIGEIAGRLYLTMALVEGNTLAEIIKVRKSIDPRTSAILVRKLSLAVHYAHSKGIIHRDLKPANIMIKPDRDLVIMDFGLARKVEHDDRQLTATGAVLGTPAYMSPEQLRGDEVNTACDVYSLGIILYELLTGARPFSGTLPSIYAQVLSSESVSPASRSQTVPPQLDAICRKATHRSLGERYQTAAQLASALSNFLATDSNSAQNSQSLYLAKDFVSATIVRAIEEAPNAPTLVGNRTYSENYLATYNRNRIRRRRQVNIGLGLLGFTMLVAMGVIITIYKKDGSKAVIEVKGDAREIVIDPDDKLPVIVVQQAPAADLDGTPKTPIGKTTETLNAPLPPDATREMRVKRLRELGCSVHEDPVLAPISLDIPRSVKSVHDCLAIAKFLPIRGLNVNGCELNDDDLTTISMLPLQELHMNSCSGFSEKGIESLQQLVNLGSLNLNESKVTDASVAALSKLKNLTVLTVGYTQLSDDGVTRLADALPALQHFNISQLPITDEAVQRLSKHQNLAVVVLYDTKVTDAAIDNLLQFDHLEWLLIANTRISEAGLLRFLDHANTKRNLVRLHANREVVTDKVCSAIARLEKISELTLGDSLLTDNGLKELAKCRSLVVVDIGGCKKVTESGVAQLRSSLPNCKVFSSFGAP